VPEASALGIDLGSPTTPSVVLFEAGHAVVGAVAREVLATEPESVVQGSSTYRGKRGSMCS
jgi:molecular chaperone DnaK (HSP70)